MSSAVSFDLDQSKILSSGNGLNVVERSNTQKAVVQHSNENSSTYDCIQYARNFSTCSKIGYG